MLKKNSEYVVTIEGYNSEAHGVARVEGFAVFVPGAIRGEVWHIKTVKVTAAAIYAKGIELVRASAERIKPDCRYYGGGHSGTAGGESGVGTGTACAHGCGGCDTRHMSYKEEISFKLGKVNDALHRIGKTDFTVTDIIPADSCDSYRNKGIFNAGAGENGPEFGFFKERTHDLIPIDSCLIQKEICGKVCACVSSFMRANKIKAYDEETGSGTVRHIFCRSGVYTKDAVVCIIAARGLGAHTGALVDALLAECPELTGIVLCINKERYNTVLAGDFYTLYGKPEITDYIGRYEFVISPRAFFQINPPQAEKLYAKALDFASRGKTDSCLELYCGSGTISLFLSGRFKEVLATEIVDEAIANANENAARNGVTNVSFMRGDAGETADYALRSGRRFDCVVVDPPRKGMDEAAVEAVAKISPDRIVYVSCNPATLARDILRFGEKGYTLEDATAVDMFPRTKHVETVVLLCKK